MFELMQGDIWLYVAKRSVLPIMFVAVAVQAYWYQGTEPEQEKEVRPT